MDGIPYSRMEGARGLAESAGADGLLVTHLPNICYLCGFSGSSGVLFLDKHESVLFTDGRYTVQAREEVRHARVQIARGSALGAAGNYLRRRRRGRLGYEPSRLSVAGKKELERAAGPGVRWREISPGVENLREVKSPDERVRMRDAARLGSEVVEAAMKMVRPGISELDLAAEIDYRMRRSGAEGPAFETIVASGGRSALPHARPTRKRLQKNELVVLDLGVILAHYCCDLTRTVYLGRAPARIRRWYAAVLEAQTAALDALKAGVSGGQVDAAARRVLRRHGLGRYFPHSTGHGLGLEIHEGPRLARGETKRIAAGNVVTLEPGIYVEGVGGIRIEDDVAVLPGSVDVLTTAPREFLEL